MKTLQSLPGQRGPLPETVIAFSTADLMAYGAATWDWHRMHYDPDYAKAVGLQAPVIDGQMYGAYFAKLALAWAGPGATIRRLSLRMRAIAFVGETLRFSANVLSIDGGEVQLDQQVHRAGTTIATARTTAVLPRSVGLI